VASNPGRKAKWLKLGIQKEKKERTLLNKSKKKKTHLKSMNSGFNCNLRLGKGRVQILALHIHGVIIKMKIQPFNTI